MTMTSTTLLLIILFVAGSAIGAAYLYSKAKFRRKTFDAISAIMDASHETMCIIQQEYPSYDKYTLADKMAFLSMISKSQEQVKGGERALLDGGRNSSVVADTWSMIRMLNFRSQLASWRATMLEIQVESLMRFNAPK